MSASGQTPGSCDQQRQAILTSSTTSASKVTSATATATAKAATATATAATSATATTGIQVHFEVTSSCFRAIILTSLVLQVSTKGTFISLALQGCAQHLECTAQHCRTQNGYTSQELKLQQATTRILLTRWHSMWRKARGRVVQSAECGCSIPWPQGCQTR